MNYWSLFLIPLILSIGILPSLQANLLPAADAIKNDKAFTSKLTEKEIDAIFSPEKHLGASPKIISNVNQSVQKTVKKFI